MKLKILSFLLIAVGAIFGVTNLVATAQETPTMVPTLGANKTQVTAGEEFQYVVTVHNTGSTSLNTVKISQNLSDKVTYKPASTTFESGTNTIAVTDSWLTDGVNVGSVTAGNRVYLRFNVTVKQDVAVGSKIDSVIQVRAEGIEWKQDLMSIDVVSADQRAVLRGGNFMRVANITKGGNGWQEQQVTGDPGDIIEYLVYVRNDGQHPARNVKIKASLPGRDQIGTQLTPSVTLSSDNAESVTDNVQVTLSSPGFMEIRTGHARIGGVTDLFNCPNECAFPESLYHTPVNMGTVMPGEERTIQIKFKSDTNTWATATPTATPTSTPTATPTSTPTSTPTATPSPTPTATPMLVCNSECTDTNQCASGLVCHQDGSKKYCRHSDNLASQSCDTRKTGGFLIRKYHDQNGDGHQNNNEKGLSWKFQWDQNADNNWRDYETFESPIGEGGVVTLSEGTQVRIREKGQDGWSATTPTEVTIYIKKGENQLMVFGNWRGKPQVLGTTSVTKLPKTGTTLFVGLATSTTMALVGVYLHRRGL